MYNLSIATFFLFFAIIETIAKALVKKENSPKALFRLKRVIKTFLRLRIETKRAELVRTLIEGKTLVIAKVILVEIIIKG